MPIPAFPVAMTASPGRFAHAAPGVGEHTDEILIELGYSPADIDGLRQARVV
jgi:crotonobetainyl-CoA:carnitine CoA-transferase CaiB-like acyl-CoA transferase